MMGEVKARGKNTNKNSIHVKFSKNKVSSF